MPFVHSYCSGMLSWNRLLNNPKAIPKLCINIKPDERKLRAMLDVYKAEGDMDKLKRAQSLVAATQRSHGAIKALYTQKSFRLHADPAYGGSLDIGRAWTNAIPLMGKKLRNTIFKETHYEIDMKNAWPTILLHYLREENDVMNALEAWVMDRNGVCQQYLEHYGVDEKTMKKAVIATISSFPDTSIGINEDIPYHVAQRIKESQFYQELVKDVGKISKNLQTMYPGFFNTVKNKRIADEETERCVEGVAMTQFASDVEYAIINNVMHKFTGMDDVYYNFDGILFPKTICGSTTTAFVHQVEQHVQSQFGIPIKFAMKDMSEPSYTIVPSADEYPKWKVHFERMYFVSNCHRKIMRIDHFGKLQALNDSEFNMFTAPEPQEFIKKWKSDPDRRTVEEVKTVVPPAICPSNVYNLWAGFDAEKLDPVPSHEVSALVGPIDRHLALLCGGDEYGQYVKKVLACKFQNPAQSTRIMICIRSLQGTGKDLMADFLQDVMGSDYVHRASNVGSFLGKPNNLLNGKILAVASECNYKDLKAHFCEVKHLATGGDIKNKDMYVSEYTIHNMVQLICFTNEFSTFTPSVDDRRMAIFTSSGKYANDATYFDPLIAAMKDQRVQRAYYQDLMEMDLSKFNPSAERPVTEAFEEQVKLKPHHMETFIYKSWPTWKSMGRMIGGFLRIKKPVFHDGWLQYSQEHQIERKSEHATKMWGTSLLGEWGPHLDKFMPDPPANMSAKEIKDTWKPYRSKDNRHGDYVIFHVQSVEQWIERVYVPSFMTEVERWGDFPDEDEEPQPKRQRVTDQFSVHRTKPGESPKYYVLKNDKVILTTDDLEDANKTMGFAYVDTRENGQVMVNPITGAEFELGWDYMDEHGKQKLEAKYPWYIYDRIR